MTRRGEYDRSNFTGSAKLRSKSGRVYCLYLLDLRPIARGGTRRFSTCRRHRPWWPRFWVLVLRRNRSDFAAPVSIPSSLRTSNIRKYLPGFASSAAVIAPLLGL